LPPHNKIPTTFNFTPQGFFQHVPSLSYFIFKILNFSNKISFFQPFSSDPDPNFHYLPTPFSQILIFLHSLSSPCYSHIQKD
jgi:hypothetical protein